MTPRRRCRHCGRTFVPVSALDRHEQFECERRERVGMVRARNAVKAVAGLVAGLGGGRR